MKRTPIVPLLLFISLPIFSDNLSGDEWLQTSDDNSGSEIASTIFGVVGGIALLSKCYAEYPIKHPANAYRSVAPASTVLLPEDKATSQQCSGSQIVSGIAGMISALGLSVSLPIQFASPSATLSIYKPLLTLPGTVYAEVEGDVDNSVFHWFVSEGERKTLYSTRTPFFSYTPTLAGEASLQVQVLSDNSEHRPHVQQHDLTLSYTIEDKRPTPTMAITENGEFAPVQLWIEKDFNIVAEDATLQSCRFIVNGVTKPCTASEEPNEIILQEPGNYSVLLEVTDSKGGIGISAPHHYNISPNTPTADIFGCEFLPGRGENPYMTAKCFGDGMARTPGSDVSSIRWLINGELYAEGSPEVRYNTSAPEGITLTLQIVDSLGHVGEASKILFLGDNPQVIDNPTGY